MFKTRLISGIVLMIISITTVVLGNNVLFGTVLVVSLIGMTELYKILEVEKKFLGIMGYLAAVIYYILIYFEQFRYLTLFFVSYLLLIMAVYVISFPKYRIEQVLMTYFGLFYVAVMLSYLYRVRILEDGAILIWLIFIGSWGSDTSAYCAGMLFGKHKVFPKLSPKKTLEGCLGGIIGAGLLGFIYALAVGSRITEISNPRLVFTLIGAASSIISQIGDLAASAIKRNYGIKDYGKLIPGHGGILDRFDSMIFTAPIVYYLAVFF